ncbi:MAG TPA: hypothetical protein VN038_01245 [Dyadobacter sp.]|nr:hypothetical protein [Dyadobacter sp.]
MAETTAPRFTSIRVKQGDRWDTIAYDAWGDANAYRDLIYDNPHLPINMELPVGETVYIRIKTDPISGETRPFWFQDEDLLNETLGETDTATVPVVEGPPVPLGFSPGYPKVEGNKILFAINKSARYPYSVEKTSGGVVAESSGYDFASGFPVSTADIQDGGYYVVKVGNITSAPLTVQGAGAPLAFLQTPAVTKVGTAWQLKYSINKTGLYRTKITNLAGNTVVFDQMWNYTSGFVVTLPVSAEGSYKLEVIGVTTLTHNFTIADSGESTTKPAWLTAAGYRYDPNSHDFTMELDATADLEVEVTATVGGNPSGKDQDGNPWGAGIYNPGTAAWATPPYDERFSFNPNVAATGGLLPSTQYRFRIRRTSVPDDIFVLYFQTPAAATPPGDPTPIDLEEQGTACAVRPTITGIVQADTDNVTFQVSGQGYETLKWRVKRASDSEVVRSGTVAVFVGGVPQFVPSNQPTVNFLGLANGDYIFEIEGGNCTSTPHTATFTVTDGGTGSTGTLEVAAYYSDEGTADFKVRINGTTPYAVSATNDSNDVVFTATGVTSDEIEISDSIMAALGSGGIKIEASDDDGKVGTIEFSGVDLMLKKKWHIGFSVANGNIDNHLEAINEGETMDFTTIGVIKGSPSTDAEYNAYLTSVNDHTVSTGGTGTFDAVTKLAYTKTKCKHLRMGSTLVRDDNKLNNGTTRTLFFGLQDCMMRVDGVTPFHKVSTGVVAREMVGSPASPAFRAYAKRIALADVKHNLPAILDGTIAFWGQPIGSSGECEYLFHLEGPNGEVEGTSTGDFHPASVALFKQRFPEYNGLTNSQISAAFGNGSPLDLAWKEHHALTYAEFVHEVYDYVLEQVPALYAGRKKLTEEDCGSFVDELSPMRMSQNALRRMHKLSFLWKSNDNSNRPASTIDYILDHVSSLARRTSGIAMVEPSPPGDAGFDNPISQAYIAHETDESFERGIGISWVNNNDGGYVTTIMGMTTVVPGALPKPKLEFVISGSDKVITRLNRNISDVFKTGAQGGGWESAWSSFRTSNSLTHVDTLSVDDIVPEVEEGGGGPGPGPGPGTGVFTPTLMYNGWPEVLSVTITGVGGSTSEDWLINASCSKTLDAGYEKYWIVDDNIIKQAGDLVNYPYQSNEEVSIVVMYIKIGTDTLFRWANPGENKYIPGFSDPNLGQDLGFAGLGASGASAVYGFQEVSA